MTLIIAMHHGSVVSIAADTREVISCLGKAIPISDSALKIHELSHGLVAGTGPKKLLNAVYSELDTVTVESTDDVLYVIRKNIDHYRKHSHSVRSVDEIIEFTGWVYSYRTITDGSEALRLSAYHSSCGDGFFHVNPGECLSFFPLDINADHSSEINDLLNKIAKELNGIHDCNQILTSIMSVYIEIYSLVFELTSSVSNSFNLAVYSLNEGIGVSKAITKQGKVIEFGS